MVLNLILSLLFSEVFHMAWLWLKPFLYIDKSTYLYKVVIVIYRVLFDNLFA